MHKQVSTLLPMLLVLIMVSLCSPMVSLGDWVSLTWVKTDSDKATAWVTKV